MTINIDSQIAAVESAIKANPEDKRLKAALETLKWVKAHRPTIVAVHRDIVSGVRKVILEEFPGAMEQDEDDSDGYR